MKRLLAALLALLLAASLLLTLPLSASAEEHHNLTVNRFNVVLVVDKSGSLKSIIDPYTGRWVQGSDDDGLRFDAMKLFLALLTESGNHVGAVLFDGTVKDNYIISPEEMGDQYDKDSLVSRIRQLAPAGDTNIGLGIEKATDMLLDMKAKNGLPCVLLLLTDGKTEFTEGDDRSGREGKSKQKGIDAANRARNAGVTVYGILLGDGKTVDERARLEMAGYTKDYTSVKSADELTAAFRDFYAIINNTKYTGAEQKKLENGYANVPFRVPSFGLEEVNIVIEHPADGKKPLDESIAITVIQQEPDETEYRTEGHKVVTSHYIIVKIPQPAAGNWRVELSGPDGDTVDVSKIFNSSLILTFSRPESMIVNHSYSFSLKVEDETRPGMILSPSDLESMKATLHLLDGYGNELAAVPMTAEAAGGGYRCDYLFEREIHGSAYATLSTEGDFEIRTAEQKVEVSAPPPETQNGVEELTGRAAFSFTRKSELISFAGLFSDPKGTALHYSLADDEGCAGRVRLEGETLVVARSGMRFGAEEIKSAWEELRGMGKVREELRFTLVATDSYGESEYEHQSCSIPVTIIVTDSRLPTLCAIALALAAVGIALGVDKARRASLPFNPGIMIDAFDGETHTKLNSLYNFHGRRSLEKLGSVYGARARDYCFETTTNPRQCVFRSRRFWKKFYVNGRPRAVRSVRISSGIPVTVTFDRNGSQGLNINCL